MTVALLLPGTKTVRDQHITLWVCVVFEVHPLTWWIIAIERVFIERGEPRPERERKREREKEKGMAQW